MLPEEMEFHRNYPFMLVDRMCPGVIVDRCRSFSEATGLVKSMGAHVVSLNGCVVTFENVAAVRSSFISKPHKDQSCRGSHSSNIVN